MNFAYLVGFQALECVDKPVLKTMDIFVCEMNGCITLNSFQTFFTNHGVLYYFVHEEQAHH